MTYLDLGLNMRSGAIPEPTGKLEQLAWLGGSQSLLRAGSVDLPRLGLGQAELGLRKDAAEPTPWPEFVRALAWMRLVKVYCSLRLDDAWGFSVGRGEMTRAGRDCFSGRIRASWSRS